MLRLAHLLVITAAFGCAPSSYGPAGFWSGDGYSETRLSSTRHRITFAGNQHTSSERASEFALLRAAELTLDAGRQHFIVMREDVKIETNMRTGGGAPGAPSVDFENYPIATVIIRMVSRKPGPDRHSYDAAVLRETMQERYDLELQ